MGRLHRQEQQYDELSLWRNPGHDVPAGIVVFLVAVPLCLGIALASGAPLTAGIIAGFVGGLVIPLVSRSAVGVSGPAAGLTVIVFDAIQELGFNPFLLAVVIGGVFQVVLGILRAGIIGYYFPSSVITGMLAGIGIIIALKQLPHAVGYDSDWEGNIAFVEPGGGTTLSALVDMIGALYPGAIVIAAISLLLLILWESPFIKDRFGNWLPGPLIAVVAGISMHLILRQVGPEWALTSDHLVQLPVMEGWKDWHRFFAFPDFSHIGNSKIYSVALTLAVVASLESLLSVEAADKLDPYKRVTPTDRELVAQGTANAVSGLIGGLPITQVIVRTSANVQAGARTRLAAMVHGLLLFVSALFFPSVLNFIPLSSLAAILLVVGYKLARPQLFIQMYRAGWYQFAPFLVTVVGLVFTDLLTGIGIGMVTALFFILLEHYKCGVYLQETHEDDHYLLRLSEQVTFLNKANLLWTLDRIPPQAKVVIDGTATRYIDHDVLEIIENFRAEAAAKHIKLTLIGLPMEGSLPTGAPVDFDQPS